MNNIMHLYINKQLLAARRRGVRSRTRQSLIYSRLNSRGAAPKTFSLLIRRIEFERRKIVYEFVCV